MPFNNIYDSGKRALCLFVQIKCKGTTRFRAFAQEYGKKNSKYADRIINVDNGKRTIFFSFPVSPEKIQIGVVNAENPADNDFEVLLIEAPLRTYNIHVDAQADKFMQFAASFSQMCGYSPATAQGRMFLTKDQEFRIRYVTVITDRKTGRPMSTPARISHDTGIIEIAKEKFDRYTVPMRFFILMHEFSHKYRNPKIGLEISDESGADINALYLALGSGWSKIDAICVFAKVFLTATSDGNMRRMRLINDYVSRFEKGEFASKNF